MKTQAFLYEKLNYKIYDNIILMAQFKFSSILKTNNKNQIFLRYWENMCR